MKTAFLYDVFISYSDREGEWVWNWLVPRLRAASLRICIDRESFDIGVPSLTNMERAVEQSRKTLLVLTPNWVESEWTNFEALLMQTDDPIGLQRRMLPLMLQQCKPPKRVSIFTHADFTNSDKWEKQLGRIIDAINDKVNLPQAVAVSGTRLTPLPPRPYLAHPYPMPKHWTGRQAEMDQLDAWLKDDDGLSMCCLVAMGGMGKSSLAWAWLQRRAVPEQEAFGLSGIFQWSFYEGEISFQHFLEDLSVYLAVSAISDPLTALTQRLFSERLLLVLDGFERLLCAYASAEAALLPEQTAEELKTGERRCIEWTTARFLRSLVAGGASKVLLTSRLVPEELDGLEGWLPMDLLGLEPADAEAYLRASGIKGTSRELREVAAVYGFHALSLSKLVEVLHYDIDQPDDIRQAPRYDVMPDLKARQHHILQQAYETLPPALAQFLSALAAPRGKATIEVTRFLAGNWPDAELSANLRRLEEDRWVLRDREQRTLDFHPVVRRYVYGRLEDKLDTHAQLMDYFRPLADAVNTERVESVTDLAPVIELYHHTVRAGRYDEAMDLYYHRLRDSLFYRFGVYQTEIELLRALFPDGEDHIPRLKNEHAQAVTLSDLAADYSVSGQPRRAVPLYEAATRIMERQGDKTNLARGLVAVESVAYLPLGELAAAEQSLRCVIELCSEIKDEFLEAIGHQELGRLLVYQGGFAKAEEHLATARERWHADNDYGGMGLAQAYRCIAAIFDGRREQAHSAAVQALELAIRGHYGTQVVERDIIRAEWLLGAAHRALDHLPQAEKHLAEALTRCRRINMVDHEPDILLETARLRWARAQGSEVMSDESTRLREETLELTREALDIADRCEYRLKQADIHNFLAHVALEQGEREEARKHAEIAKERAWCDGPPHCYKPALEEAKRILKSCGGG